MAERVDSDKAGAGLERDGLPSPRRYWAVASVLLAITMAVVDGSIVNVALPRLSVDLGVAPDATVWIVTSYQIAILICLLPFSALGEIVGFRRVFLSGLSLFLASSLACALSQTLTTLVLARAAQGVGAAAVFAVIAALLRFTYPRAMIGRGIAANAFTASFSGVLGPPLGSLVLSVADWHWMFLMNLPIGLLALAIGARALPGIPRSRRPFDWTSAGLSAAMFGSLIVMLDHLATQPLLALAGVASAGAFGLVLVRRELPKPSPLLPVDLLRLPVVALAVSASSALFAAQLSTYVALPFLFQHALGRSQVETGLLMIPAALTTAAMAPLAGWLADRGAGQRSCVVGAALFASATALLSLLPGDAGNAHVIGCMILLGIGFGLFQTPNNRTMLLAAPPARAGGAGGMQGTARQFGLMAGSALAALCLGAGVTNGPVLSLWLACALASIALVLSLARGSVKAV
ncbi:MFS transporter [Zavarzinia sp. CC-PAN008]|uniref:MFS transporter n=1 Tax=Zavarzinia sp. CC-PAN008 TaxID=3243332 RepID=UPI003F743436